MSANNAQNQEWTQSLRNMTAIGASIATLILIPPTLPLIPITTPSIEQAHVKIITTLPDGSVDLNTLHFSTSQGINTGIYLISGKLNQDEVLHNNNLPHQVREISGLPVDMLADLVGVSRMAYHKWLANGGVKSEHVAQLTKLFDTFQTLHNLRIPDLRAFLENAGPSGKPYDLLASGDVHAVIGLALRSSAKPQAPSTLSEEAYQISGLTGWIRPAKRLNWNTLQLTELEKEDALDLLSPKPLSEDMVVIDDSDEDH